MILASSNRAMWSWTLSLARALPGWLLRNSGGIGSASRERAITWSWLASASRRSGLPRRAAVCTIPQTRVSVSACPSGGWFEVGLILARAKAVFWQDTARLLLLVLADGTVEYNGQRGSIHQLRPASPPGALQRLGAVVLPGPETGDHWPIDRLRQILRINGKQTINNPVIKGCQYQSTDLVTGLKCHKLLTHGACPTFILSQDGADLQAAILDLEARVAEFEKRRPELTPGYLCQPISWISSASLKRSTSWGSRIGYFAT